MNIKNITIKWKLLIAFVASLLLMLCIFLYVNRGPKNNGPFKANPTVSIHKENDRFSFYRNGSPFIVKGGSGYTYIKELAECGGNTIVCWDTSKIASTLNEAEQFKVAVIIGLDIPGGEHTEFYENEKNIAKFYNAYKKIVEQYKDHPAVLAWCLGNELVMPYLFDTDPFFNSYNRLLSMIHELDPDHPVSTSVINIPKKHLINIQWRIPALDFISVNSYNSLRKIGRDLNIMKIFWNGPYLIGEWAPDGGWEVETTIWDAPIENTSTRKAELYYDLYSKYMPVNDSRFLGSLAFYWGYRQEYTHTWYSVFNENGVSTEIKEVLRDCWQGKLTKHESPIVKYMLVDSLEARQNVILSSGSEHRASILMEPSNSKDSLSYHWEILKEDWMFWGHTWKDFKKPAVLADLLKDSSLQYSRFVAPAKGGPYRIFVTVFNNKGYCATANMPIYVIEK